MEKRNKDLAVKGISVALILAWIAFIVTTAETMIESDPRMWIAIAGLLAGVFLIVGTRFIRKVQEGEIDIGDFNPLYIFLDLAAVTLAWQLLYQTALTIPLDATPIEIFWKAFYQAGMATGLIEAFWALIRIAWKFGTKA